MHAYGEKDPGGLQDRRGVGARFPHSLRRDATRAPLHGCMTIPKGLRANGPALTLNANGGLEEDILMGKGLFVRARGRRWRFCPRSDAVLWPRHRDLFVVLKREPCSLRSPRPLGSAGCRGRLECKPCLFMGPRGRRLSFDKHTGKRSRTDPEKKKLETHSAPTEQEDWPRESPFVCDDYVCMSGCPVHAHTHTHNTTRTHTHTTHAPLCVCSPSPLPHGQAPNRFAPESSKPTI